MTVFEKYEKITRFLIENNLTISTMESCTAGTVASLLTDTEGASKVFVGSIVAYDNATKVLFGVGGEVIEKFGVYSKETATAMATASINKFFTELSIGVTGSFANPDPNNIDSVPGEVHFAISNSKDTIAKTVNVKNTERQKAKLEVAEKIADTLLEIFD